MAAASFRYGLTIVGAVLLVTGTLCFAWWSDGEVGSGGGARLLPPREAQAVPSPSSPSALLRSVSFFCCGVGGILLVFGLLWSVKANARVVSRRYQYHFPRDLQYFTAEPPEKWNCSSWDASAIPTYEEALTCRPAHGAPAYVQPPGRKEELTPPLYRYLEEDESWQGGRRRSSSDSALFRPSPSWLEPPQPPEPQGTPPPSYENINESINESISEGISESISESIHENINESISESIHENISEGIHENISHIRVRGSERGLPGPGLCGRLPSPSALN